jgi:hypothetical protein
VSVLDIKRKRKVAVIQMVPPDIRFARLTERVATLNSVIRSQAYDVAHDARHNGSQAGLDARITQLETAVSQLEAAVA